MHNYTISGFIFYVLAIASYLISLFTHRKEAVSKQQKEEIKTTIEHTKLQINLFQVAKDAYAGKKRRINDLIATLNSFDISESEKHDLYNNVINAERGHPPKNNPYKK